MDSPVIEPPSLPQLREAGDKTRIANPALSVKPSLADAYRRAHPLA
jgi:hypothetical protein